MSRFHIRFILLRLAGKYIISALGCKPKSGETPPSNVVLDLFSNFDRQSGRGLGYFIY